MREVDIERIRELAGHLQDAVRQLREIGRGSVERRAPADYADCSAVLAEIGAIGSDLRGR